MSLVRGAAHGVGWGVAGGYLSQVIAFVIFIAISRVVGPTAFGVVAVALGLVELCRSISSDNTAGVLVAKPAFDREAFDAGFAWTLGSAFVQWIALVVLAPALSALFKIPQLASVLPQIGVLIVFMGASRLQEARLVQQMRFQALAFRSIVASLIGGALGIIAAYCGAGVEALVYQQWASALVSAALLWSACDWRPSPRFSRAVFTRTVRASLTLTPASLIGNLSVMIDGLAVSVFSGAAAAGIYNLGKRIRLAMQLSLTNALERVSLPAFARLQPNPAALAHALTRAINISALVGYPVFFGLAAVAPELIGIALGPAWTSAAAPTSILVIGGAIAITTTYFENILLVREQRRTIVAMRAILLAVLIAGLLLLGRYGPAATAFAAAGAALTHNLVALFVLHARKQISISAYLRAIGPALLLSSGMFALLALMRANAEIAALPQFARLALLVAVGAAIYGAGVWALARASVEAAFNAARVVLAPGQRVSPEPSP